MSELDEVLEGDIGTLPTCNTCGSENVVRDAWASWSPDNGMWDLHSEFDQQYCLDCEGETHFVWKRVERPKRSIAQLNDALRNGEPGLGQVVITQGIQALGNEFIAKAMRAIAAFNDFNVDNDPHDEHDFGSMVIAGATVFWKIDYYDRLLTFHSDDPKDPNQTKRVLTVMLAEEY